MVLYTTHNPVSFPLRRSRLRILLQSYHLLKGFPFTHHPLDKDLFNNLQPQCCLPRSPSNTVLRDTLKSPLAFHTAKAASRTITNLDLHPNAASTPRLSLLDARGNIDKLIPTNPDLFIHHSQ